MGMIWVQDSKKNEAATVEGGSPQAAIKYLHGCEVTPGGPACYDFATSENGERAFKYWNRGQDPKGI